MATWQKSKMPAQTCQGLLSIDAPQMHHVLQRVKQLAQQGQQFTGHECKVAVLEQYGLT